MHTKIAKECGSAYVVAVPGGAVAAVEKIASISDLQCRVHVDLLHARIRHGFDSILTCIPFQIIPPIEGPFWIIAAI